MDNSVRELAQGAVAQCVSSVMRSRHAVRAVKAQPLHRKLVEDILGDAATAPSGANIQPWRMYAVSGTAKDKLSDALLAASRAGSAPAHFPDPLPEVFRARLQDFGARYYASLGSGHATPLVDGLDRIAPEQCAIVTDLLGQLLTNPDCPMEVFGPLENPSSSTAPV